MYDIRITSIRKADYRDLQALYENPIQHTCDVSEGPQWVSVGGAMLAFRVGKGTHTIKLSYSPQGFTVGMICTVLAILIFIAMIFVVPRRRKVFAKVYAKLDARAEASQKAKAEKAQAKTDEAPENPEKKTKKK